MQEHNVDPNEIAKFDEKAHLWWDENGDMRTLHQINPTRLRFVTDHVTLAGKNIVDVGCGGGILTESLAKAGPHEIYGIDLSTQLIGVAKLHAKANQLPIHYHKIGVEHFAEQHPHHFDVVTCMELLEHVPDPESIVAHCAKLTKKNGRIFFSTINRTAKAFLLAIVGAEYLLHLVPQNTHEYSKFIKPSELDNWCRKHNLKIIDIKGMHYNPLTKTASLKSDVSVNYLVCCEKQ